jgi:hypothetical protein
MNIVEDFMILRKQVPADQLADKELKQLFKENKFDIVASLLKVEEKFNGKKDYRSLDIVPDKSENVKKIEELRGYTIEKNAILQQKQKNTTP